MVSSHIGSKGQLTEGDGGGRREESDVYVYSGNNERPGDAGVGTLASRARCAASLSFFLKSINLFRR